MKISIIAICVVEGSEQDPVEGRGWACEMNVYVLYVNVCVSKMSSGSAMLIRIYVLR